ncbi:cytochrome c oxidase assembly protein [Bacillus sp. 37MA]|uniref:cytochrome c oxidase assembly protein n=1 Tax=Bacillus sp. 37MA TaxID=1132442 RepID=UPI00035D7940|nr:cytochrome c oxidase assembly protein [Bacillus sp. 37MA]
MSHAHIHQSNGVSSELMLALPFVLFIVLYILAAVVSNRSYKQWPLYRYIFWIFGVLCAGSSVIGPLANSAHQDFTVHMLGHLLLGMLAPLLMVLAAPMTLIFRTLNVSLARHLSRMLKSRPVRIWSHPVVASLLNIGGLWVLYTTDLYSAMQQAILLHIFIHIHVFFAGYLFTISMIYIDPAPHHFRFDYRAIVLIMALTGHGILSKYLYAHPPKGVPAAQAETGGMLMYYGGDIIDLVLISILCLQWYKATRPRAAISTTA